MILDTISLLCGTTIVVMLLIGVIFDEKDYNYWTLFYYVFSFFTGIRIGILIFSTSS